MRAALWSNGRFCDRFSFSAHNTARPIGMVIHYCAFGWSGAGRCRRTIPMRRRFSSDSDHLYVVLDLNLYGGFERAPAVLTRRCTNCRCTGYSVWPWPDFISESSQRLQVSQPVE
jgi:hypothetical protein